VTRVVLVTGANRGIGRELASQLVVRGDTVVLTTRDLAKAERAAAGLPDPQRVLARRLDVTDPATIAQVAADLDRRYGRLDVLVNNAAIHYDTWQQASTADLQVVREALEVNLLGAWQTSLTLLPLLRRSGHGRIVNVSSEAGSLASMDGGAPAYKVSPWTLPRSSPPPARGSIGCSPESWSASSSPSLSERSCPPCASAKATFGTGRRLPDGRPASPRRCGPVPQQRQAMMSARVERLGTGDLPTYGRGPACIPAPVT
jgi:hypothetical protein